MSSLIENKNPLANPYNGIQLGVDVNCGCDCGDVACQANFDYVYDEALDTLTVTDKSFLSAGDAIVSPSGVTITVTDSDVPTPTSVVDNTGDGTAPVVVSVVTLSTAGTFRIDYTIVTDDGCTSTITTFFTPLNANEATGSSDYYSQIR